MRARISARVARFEDGHFGDHKQLGDGGDKSSQDKDVKNAKEFFKAYLEEVKDANKKS